MLRRPQYIGFVVVVLIALVLLNLPGHFGTRLKQAIGAVFLPLFGLAESASAVGENAGARLLPKSTLIGENERLKQENEQLKLKLMQSEEVWRENTRLREAVLWQKSIPWQTKLAKVILREPANWWRAMTIDLGSNNGVVTNLPVVTAQGLVGRIDEVSANYSRVVLVGDPNCRVYAVVDNKARDSGMIAPGSSTVLDQSIVELTYLPSHSQLVPGQKIFTSGTGGIFPKGILIGHIMETNSVEFGLYMEARVKLATDLNDLEFVSVIFK